MKGWQDILRASITRPSDLAKRFPALDAAGLEQVAAVYPMRVNPYYLSLIQEVGDPLWRQAIPDARELTDTRGLEDPLNEEGLSPVPCIVHKYADRALLLVTTQCAMYCRFCTRKRKVGTSGWAIDREMIRAGFDYLQKNRQVRDVLVSGGDPLLLPDATLEWLLDALRRIPSIEIIRIGSRVPCTLPMRVTPRLASLLKRYHPLYINTHFNHPAELTPQAALACRRLADAGIPLGCQTVLLRGVNDQPLLIRELMHGLLRLRVKPYYLFQGDLTQGTDHFRTPIKTGQAIMRSLIGHTSGLAVPTYALDAPGGGGKVPLTPNYTKAFGRQLVFENYCGEIYNYPDGNPEG